MRAMLSRGWSAFVANRRMVLYLYLTKLGLALIVTLPILFTIQAAMNNSLYASPLLREWSLAVIGEVIAQRPFLFGHSFILLIVLALIAWLLRMFLNGGIYKAYADGIKFGSTVFFSESGRQFGIHMRISGVMILIYLVGIGVGMLGGSLAGRAVLALFPDSGDAALACWLACIGLALAPAIAFSDTLRAATTSAGSPAIRTLLTPAFSFYRAHWVQLIGAYLMIVVPFIMVWAVVEISAMAVTTALGNKAGVMIELVIFQACSFLRMSQSLLFTASVIRAYQPPRPVPHPTIVIELPR